MGDLLVNRFVQHSRRRPVTGNDRESFQSRLRRQRESETGGKQNEGREMKEATGGHSKASTEAYCAAGSTHD